MSAANEMEDGDESQEKKRLKRYERVFGLDIEFIDVHKVDSCIL